MQSTQLICCLCTAAFVVGNLHAEQPKQFGQLEATGVALMSGKETSPVMWDAIRREINVLIGSPEVMMQINLPDLVKASTPIFLKNAMSENYEKYNMVINAQLLVTSLLGRAAALQSGSGVIYRSAPDEITLIPLLSLANNWLTISENLKSKGADASGPKYTGGDKILEISPLNDEMKAIKLAMIAEHTKKREKTILNGKLNLVTRQICELSITVKSIVDRLNAAGKTIFVTEAIAASGITQARFDQIIQNEKKETSQSSQLPK